MLPEDAPHVWQLPPAIASLQLRNVNVKRQAKLDLFLRTLHELAGYVEKVLYSGLRHIIFSVLIGRDVVTDVLWPRAAPRLGEIEQRLRGMHVALMCREVRSCMNRRCMYDCEALGYDA